MYRPSDAEIAAAAQVLKDYKMPSGWNTAAVLALVAAAKVRNKHKKIKKRTDEEMVRFLDGVAGVVIASREEMQAAWERNQSYGDKKRTWESNNSGLGELVGHLEEDRPVYITLWTAKIDGHKILFVDATSQVVDWAMIDEWIAVNLPDALKTDATNWTHAIPRKEN